MTSFAPIRGEALRVTRTDGCGRLVSGPAVSYTTDSFVSLEVTPRTIETEAIEVTKANGKRCVNEPAETLPDGFDITATFCGVQPIVFEIVTGMPVVYDANGEPVGYDADVAVDRKNKGLALEAWTQVSQDSCEEGQGMSYGYLLFPFLRQGALGDFTIENAAINFSVTGLSTRSGNAWGVGPYDVTLDADGAPSPLLTPLTKTNHHRMFVTQVAPPEDTGQAVASGPEATGATSGTPGTWTPVDSYAPQTFTDLESSTITASPSTAWLTGEYVVLGDGSHAYWDGTAWQVGEAP